MSWPSPFANSGPKNTGITSCLECSRVITVKCRPVVYLYHRCYVCAARITNDKLREGAIRGESQEPKEPRPRYLH